MSQLAKLNLTTVERNVGKDAVNNRRRKLVAGIDEQIAALLPQADGGPAPTRARAWHFARDGGWYVQCRYGSRVLMVRGSSNAVFVETLDQVIEVLQVFRAAALAGELDLAVADALDRGKPDPVLG